ncbi:MAG TPA: hypothetical protein VM115_02380 [Vicinamibacterales bacterium]|nr:hypothetical protein [Vicinamibacterales bacterium]
MKEAFALAIGLMLTVEQRDARRTLLDPSSVAVSADGRFVAFTTYSRLAPADTDTISDLYVLDRHSQRVTLESVHTGEDSGDVSYPGISGDGRYVVFERAQRIFVRDRNDNVTRIVGEGRQPVITSNGHLIVFTAESNGTAADPDVNGERTDIYVAAVQSAGARRISTGMRELDPAIAASVQPSVSSDGRFVAFASRAQRKGERPGVPQIFVRDLTLNVTRLVGGGWDPSISGDGRFVAFTGMHQHLPHIFLADTETGTSRLITNSTRRGAANGASGKPAISADGRFVVFQSEASDLVAAEDFNLLWDVFVFDRATGTTSRVSGDAEGVWMEPSSGPSIDARGSVIAFSSRHPTDVLDKKNDFDLYVAIVGQSNTEGRRHAGARRIDFLGKHFKSQRQDAKTQRTSS